MRRGTLGLLVVLGVPASVSVASQAADAASGGTYGNVSSTVVPQPDAAPSVFIEAEGVIYNSWSANGGWPWYPLALYTTAPPATSTVRGFAISRAVAVLQPDGSPSIFFQGVGGSLWNYWYVDGTWDAAEIVSSGVQSAPVAVLQGDGSPSVFVIGSGGSVLNYWYISGSGAWGAGTVAPAGSAVQAPAAIGGGGEPSVFVESPDHSLVEYDYTPEASGASWGTFVVAGAGSTFSAPVAVGQPDGTVSVFAVGPSHRLMNYWLPCFACCTPDGYPIQGPPASPCSNIPTSWEAGTVAPAGSAYSAASVVLQTNGNPSAFVLGPGGSVLNFWYVPGQGSWASATVESPGSRTSQVFSVLSQTDGAPEVFFARQDGSLWLSTYSGGTWNNFNWGVNDAPIETYTDSS